MMSYEELDDGEKEALLLQIEQTDFEVLSLCEKKEALNPRGKIEPIEVMQLPEIEKKRDEYTKIGLDAIRAGKVGAVLLAGGMGTRLGSDEPKGVYNIGLIIRAGYIWKRRTKCPLPPTATAAGFYP